MSRTWVLIAAILAALGAAATILVPVQGIVHDPQHRPIQDATVEIRAAASDWHQSATTDGAGEFRFASVPIGEYTVTLAANGFATATQKIAVTSGAQPVLHFALALAAVQRQVQVTAEPEGVNPQSSTTQGMVSREQIAETPGATRANSLAMITNFVPSAVLIHDQLHIRGGHQVSWMVDGVPVPNTNIASNVGPQFDPKDVDYLEVQRGGLSAENGDRAFGVFNVEPRSGFERNRQAELVASYGTQNATNDQINFGDHTARFGYYGSLSGNRTDLGLETPSPETLHDQGAGLSGFTSLIYNRGANDQLRVAASARGDHYQIPNDPGLQTAGIRDVENERDSFVNFSWVHTGAHGSMLTVSPYYHYNRASYEGGANDTPLSPTDDRRSQYAGAHVTASTIWGRHSLRAGVDAFAEHNDSLFAIHDSALGTTLQQRQTAWGDVEALFAEDSWRVNELLTLNGGVRLTRASGLITETSADPRIGAALRLPGINVVLRGFYGQYYQAPPLDTVLGPLLTFAAAQGFAFLPLRGERDRQGEVGMTVPVRGWTFDLARFQTMAHNYFDHDALGNSNIFFPLTIDHARIRGWEATARSPEIAHRVRVHLAFSNQQAQAKGDVTGGLSDFSGLERGGYFYLDHDQRNTLSVGGEARLPWRSYASLNVAYGSGFLDGDGPQHLPPHTSVDAAVGKQFGERWSMQVNATNLGNRRYLLDTSNTFGGTHYSDPRQVAVELRYRFRY